VEELKMKKYYDLPNSRLVAMLDWEDGYGSIEDARNYLKSDIDVREISLSEFNKLGKEYSSSKKVK
jgi:hypothetical protein